jgi:hypothetical protein
MVKLPEQPWELFVGFQHLVIECESNKPFYSFEFLNFGPWEVKNRLIIVIIIRN